MGVRFPPRARNQIITGLSFCHRFLDSHGTALYSIIGTQPRRKKQYYSRIHGWMPGPFDSFYCIIFKCLLVLEYNGNQINTGFSFCYRFLDSRGRPRGHTRGQFAGKIQRNYLGGDLGANIAVGGAGAQCIYPGAMQQLLTLCFRSYIRIHRFPSQG